MDSTLWRIALRALLLLVALPAAAWNHEDVVPPLAPGPFAVACSNLEQDTAAIAALGGDASDYWEGNEVNGRNRYLTEILVHPESVLRFSPRVPFKPLLYPTRFLQPVEFVAMVCYPTARTNGDPDYVLPGGGGTVPHMQPAGQPAKLLSAIEHAQTLGLPVAGVGPGPAALPLVVYSHGLGGSPLGKGYLDVAVQLAAHGFMVSAVFHADARFSRVRIEDLGNLLFALAAFPLVVEMEAMRPFALKAMTDALLDSPDYAPGIDTTRIGGFGASLGGQAMANLLGAKITSNLAGGCEATQRDPRVRAAVGYVMYAGQSFLPAFCSGQSGATEVNTPFLAIVGTEDTTAPAKQAQQAVNNFRNSRYLVELVGGKHELRPEDAGDVLTWMVTFLNAYLDVRHDDAMARLIRMRRVENGREDNIRVDVHVPFANQGGETPVREFHNSVLDHYFIAAAPQEVDYVLSGAAGPGWQLTGQSFKAWVQMPQDTFLAAAPVCRFYGGLNGGPNSHFFTVDAPECEFVRSHDGWFYEGVGFYIRSPDAARRCPAGYLAVGRVYNNGFPRNDSNHRFSSSDSTLRQMQVDGWAYEGDMFCARP